MAAAFLVAAAALVAVAFLVVAAALVEVGPVAPAEVARRAVPRSACRGRAGQAAAEAVLG